MFRKYFLLLIFSLTFYSSTANKLNKKTDCDHKLSRLADSQSKFVDCIVKYSSPAQSCTHCLILHVDMTTSWTEFAGNCSEYINKNRLNIAYNIQNDLIGVWNKGFCDDCFENQTLSNETVQFNNFTIEFLNCIDNTSSKEICQTCQRNYLELNDFYKQMDKEKNGRICFDSQDTMNRTRSRWSKDLKCCRREYDFMFFILASSLFGVLPVIFYFGMYGYTKRMERNHEVLDAGSSTGPTSSSMGTQSVIQRERPSQRERLVDSDEDIIDNLKRNPEAKTSGGKSVHTDLEASTSVASNSVQNGRLIDL